ncbi:hypothetical protein [Thiolapillus sp.]|uniref:hypothetical protein n=1 Tax=Thiolapillus sp. TaxID=2017437 RepID=UPI003AF6E404
MALVVRDQKRQAQEVAQAATGAEAGEVTPSIWHNYPVKSTLAVLVLLATGVVLVRAVLIEMPGTIILFAVLANLGAWLALAAMRAYPPEEAPTWEDVFDEEEYYDVENDPSPLALNAFNLGCNEISPWYSD